MKLRKVLKQLLDHAEASLRKRDGSELDHACRIASQWLEHGRFPDEQPTADARRAWMTDVEGHVVRLETLVEKHPDFFGNPLGIAKLEACAEILERLIAARSMPE